MASQLYRPHIWQLDAVRGFAALYVLGYHARLFRDTPAGIFFSFGPEAVIVFFLLSGFVISYATESDFRPVSLREYAVRRIARIYPTFLIAIILTYVITVISARKIVSIDVYTLTGNLAMLQDLKGLKAGAWIDVYKGNNPLWSLSYEWWFYVFYASVMWLIKIPRNLQQRLVFGAAITGVTSYLFLPSFAGLLLAYAFIWWCGVELNREFGSASRISWVGQRLSVYGLLILLLIWSVPLAVKVVFRQKVGLGDEPMLQVRHFFAAVGSLLLILTYTRKPSQFVDFLLRPLLPVGEISYALYVIHWPILHLPTAVTRIIGLILLFPTCYLLEKVLQPRISLAIRKILLERDAKSGAKAK